jgi:hypothetical protein
LSTSSNVREIWDGSRIIRQLGESQTTDLIFDKSNHTIYDSTTAVLKKLYQVHPGLHREVRPKWKTGDKEAGLIELDSDTKAFAETLPPNAANLTLNIPKSIPKPREIIAYAILGLAV